MRIFLGSLIVLVVCVALFYAAPAPEVPVPYPGQARRVWTTTADGVTHVHQGESLNERFYWQLDTACVQIIDQYVQPVTRGALFLTALKGLYEKGGRPVPADLPAEVEKAKTDAEMTALIARVRKESGRGSAYEDDLLACFQAIAASLDPNTKIITGDDPRPVTQLQADRDGFGLEIAPHDVADVLLVTAVLPGGPAQRSGLRPGDAITSLNGQAVRALPALKADELLGFIDPNGPPALSIEDEMAKLPPPVDVTFRRVGSASEQRVKLARQPFRVETVQGVNRRDDNSWNFFLDAKAGIAQVRITTLAKGTADELHDTLAELRNQKLRGLILDLRWCPGGFLNEAVDCATMFLDKEKVVTAVKSRNREATVYRANATGDFTDVPLVVLINAETTGGAELIAAALRDHDRAVIAGQRSFGKASVQTAIHLGLPYTGLRLTSGTFLRPSGKNLHRFPESQAGDDWGVCPEPELECRLSPDANRALKEAWQQVALRPGGSRERLLLDNPDVDVARQMAATAVRDK